MRKNLIRSFFSSGVQAVAVQVLGVIFIAIVAAKLSEEEFGIINWANAVAMFITTILSFGMEQVVVRRIAASDSSDWAAAAFLVHNFIGSVIALGLTFLATYVFAYTGDVALKYLPIFFGAQAVIFLVTPLKQFLNAKHMFTPYGVIAVFSNLCKIGLAAYLITVAQLTVLNVGYVLIFCALLELVGLGLYVRLKTSFSFKFKFIAYKKLLKESSPQFLAVLFDSSLSRLDWILLGLISSYVATGTYSFAYRAYEMARLPIVIIAPVILNVFAKALSSKGRMDDGKQRQVVELYTVEIFVAMLIPIILNIVWSPVLDVIFDGKYGTSNENEFLLLSICIPLHFFINLMWTLGFAAKRYKQIARVTMITAVVNLVLNLALIPLYGGMGAAIAYLATTLVQVYIYYNMVNKQLMRLPVFTLFKFLLVAAVVYVSLQYLALHIVLQLLLAVTAYILICFSTRLITIGHLKNLKQYLKK